MPNPIDDLPNELLQKIILDLPPQSVFNFQRSCRRFNELVSPLIWRHLCRYVYRYWRPECRITAKLCNNIESTDWKALFIERQHVDRQTSRAIDSIIASQVGRIDNFRKILEHSYSAKDCLIEHCRTDFHAIDVLARRYYSHAVLSSIHRALAISEWAKLQIPNGVSLERAIGAFDAFILEDGLGDFDEIERSLDDIADRIIEACPDAATYSTRQRALTINSCLREWRYVGAYDNQENHPRNHFLGSALLSEDHSSSTLISTVIFCCVAQRLGLDAMPGVFPFQVLAIVKSTSGVSVDGDIAGPTSQTAMYLHPSVLDGEISVDDLTIQLLALGIPRHNHSNLLRISTIPELVLRGARNIYHSVYTAFEARPANPIYLATNFARRSPDLEGSLYSALWALILVGGPSDEDGATTALRRQNHLPNFMRKFERDFPFDVDLIEKYIVPLFPNTDEQTQIRETIRAVRLFDSIPKEVKTRKDVANREVKYKIGQVFRHARYNYQAVITGWDAHCAAHENWISQMRVHELLRGRQQSFYHVLVDDKSVRYVAEDNIMPTQPNYPLSLIPLAGQYFKRWDPKIRCFVSNILDEYPDD